MCLKITAQARETHAKTSEVCSSEFISVPHLTVLSWHIISQRPPLIHKTFACYALLSLRMMTNFSLCESYDVFLDNRFKVEKHCNFQNSKLPFQSKKCIYWNLTAEMTVLSHDNRNPKFCRKSNLIWFIVWWMNVLEAVCKRDWHNMRSYLFFNVRKFRTQCAMAFTLWYDIVSVILLIFISSISILV